MKGLIGDKWCRSVDFFHESLVDMNIFTLFVTYKHYFSVENIVSSVVVLEGVISSTKEKAGQSYFQKQCIK